MHVESGWQVWEQVFKSSYTWQALYKVIEMTFAEGGMFLAPDARDDVTWGTYMSSHLASIHNTDFYPPPN